MKNNFHVLLHNYLFLLLYLKITLNKITLFHQILHINKNYLINIELIIQ